jgi:chromosome segregation ATPase
LEQLLIEIESNDKLINDNQTLLSKYVGLNQESMLKVGVSIEQLVETALQLRTDLLEKDDQLIRINEDIEEMRFEFDNRMLDYDELKRENYELRIRDEDRETIMLRIEEMQEQLEQLQSQKQEAQFRLDSVEMQLTSLHNNLSQEDSFKREDIQKKIKSLLHG